MLVHQILTTEKVPLNYRVAGLGARSLAWLIDLLILCVLGFAGLLFANVLAMAGRPGMGQAVLSFWLFGLMWAYFLLFEWLWNGQTPGKRVLGLRVIQWRGTAIGFLQATVRNLLRIVDCLPLGYGLGFVVAGCNRENRRLGDLAADTLVVYIDRKSRLVRTLFDAGAGREAAGDRGRASLLRQRLTQLSRDQKQTLLDLSLRRDQLGIQERARLFRAAAGYLEKRLDLRPTSSRATRNSSRKWPLCWENSDAWFP